MFPFYYCNYPYNDFLLTNKCIDSFSDNFERTDVGNYIIYTHLHSRFLESCGFMFSGTTKIDSRLVWGEEDLVKPVPNLVHNASIGNYTCIAIERSDSKGGERALLSTDFFGTCQIYYFDFDEIIIVSNRYHLLLYAMKQAGFLPHVNWNIAVQYLSCADIFTNQLMNSECLTAETHVVPVESILVVDRGGCHLEASAFGRIVSEKHHLDRIEYESLLVEAIDEIKENLRICYESPRFENVVMDLTGGIDTRIVASAMSNYPELYSRTRAFTFGHGTDLNRGSQVADYLGIRYSTGYSIVHGMGRNNYDITATMKPSEYLALRQSCVVGTDFEPNDGLTDSNVCVEKTLRLTGGTGELATRFYVSQNLGTCTDTAEMVDVGRYLDKSRDILACNHLGDVCEFLYDIIVESNCSSRVMKNEQLLIQRNRYHFNSQWANSFRTPQWQVCQSIAAFKAYSRSIDRFGNRQFIYDLLGLLAPSMRGLPFSRDDDNREMHYFWKGVTPSPVNSSPGFSFELATKLSFLNVPVSSHGHSHHSGEWRQFDIMRYLLFECNRMADILVERFPHQSPIISELKSKVSEYSSTKKGVIIAHAIYRRLSSLVEISDDTPIRFKEYIPPLIAFRYNGENTDPGITDPKSSEECYRRGLAYCRGEGVRKSDLFARYYFRLASKSGLKYMILDYLLLVSDGTEMDRANVRSQLIKYVHDDDSQAIRIFARSLLYEQNPEAEAIGLALLRYSSNLGNEWATKDLLRFCEDSQNQ